MPRNPRAACSPCGKPVHRSHSSRPEITCHECRRKNPASKYRPAFCERCGNEFQSRRSGQSPTGWTRYCSRTCYTATRFITPGVRKERTWASMSEEARARKRHRARQRHRAHQLTYDGVSDEQILRRDGWRCRMDVCLYRSRRINPEYKYPDQRSASIDHVLPLSLGGDDTEYNRRAAHLGCNMARGQGRPGESMPLCCYVSAKRTTEASTQARPPRPCRTCGELVKGKCGLHEPVRYASCKRCNALMISRPRITICQACKTRSCAVPDCNNSVFFAATDWCAAHHHRHRKYGDAFADIPIASSRVERVEVAALVR